MDRPLAPRLLYCNKHGVCWRADICGTRDQRLTNAANDLVTCAKTGDTRLKELVGPATRCAVECEHFDVV